MRRLDLDGDAKINLQEFGEAIKTQLATSNPIKLRDEELKIEKLRSSAPSKKSMGRSQSRKKISQFSQRDVSPQESASRMSASIGPNSILKAEKKRPKTAERASSRYNPNRGVTRKK